MSVADCGENSRSRTLAGVKSGILVKGEEAVRNSFGGDATGDIRDSLTVDRVYSVADGGVANADHLMEAAAAIGTAALEKAVLDATRNPPIASLAVWWESPAAAAAVVVDVEIPSSRSELLTRWRRVRGVVSPS